MLCLDVIHVIRAISMWAQQHYTNSRTFQHTRCSCVLDGASTPKHSEAGTAQRHAHHRDSRWHTHQCIRKVLLGQHEAQGCALHTGLNGHRSRCLFVKTQHLAQVVAHAKCRRVENGHGGNKLHATHAVCTGQWWWFSMCAWRCNVVNNGGATWSTMKVNTILPYITWNCHGWQQHHKHHKHHSRASMQ